MADEEFVTRSMPTPHAIIDVLAAAGIDVVFGLPGGNTLRLFDALYDYRDRIRTILCRDENLAGVMAEAYGKMTGRPGVVLGQGLFLLASGPLGTLEAHLGSSPMILLGDLSDGFPFSQHAPYQSGTGHYGTWDARATFSGFTKCTMTPTEPVEAVQATQRAVRMATMPEQGPVALLFHTNALGGEVGPDSVPRLHESQRYLVPPALQPAAVDRLAELLTAAEHPVIVAGNGVRLSRAYVQLEEAAELLAVGVCTTAGGKGVFPERHQLALGPFGNYGCATANESVRRADVVIVIGSKLSPTDTLQENPTVLDPRRQHVVQIDAQPLNASWTVPAEAVIAGDAAVVLSSLVAHIKDRGGLDKATRRHRLETVAEAKRSSGYFSEVERHSDATPLLPQQTIHELQETLPKGTIVTCDAGENRIFMHHFFQSEGRGMYLQPAASGGMGYAIPAALTAKILHPDRTVVATTGDGGFGLSLNGLLTAIEENIPIVVVIFNNRCLGWVKHLQPGREIACAFEDFNYAGIAEAMGCQAIRVDGVDGLRAGLAAAREATKPLVLDVVTDDRETFKRVTSPLLDLGLQYAGRSSRS